MKLLKGLLLGSAASVGVIALAPAARAADLPGVAPIEYVRICDAYGAGFFFIPGTDTCLRVGGLVLSEERGFDPQYSIGGTSFYGNGSLPTHAAGVFPGGLAGLGFIPSVTQYTNARSRDATSFNALGRVELDSRSQSPYGTVRAFLRVDSYFGSGGNSATGALQSSGFNNTFNNTAGTSSSRYTTILNKAFIQFAGLTAGYAQSMFDFYADAYNYNNLRGSNATTALVAYTATLPAGFSATLSAEDQASRRANIASTIAGNTTVSAAGIPTSTAVTLNGISGTSFQANPGGSRIPDIVGNLRVDQSWGAAQLSVAAHQVDSSLFASTAIATPSTSVTTYAFPAETSNSYGFAVQGGLQLNADVISPGDKLWLQAAYEHGAFGYIAGNNLGFNYGAVNQNRYAGSGFTPTDYSAGWNAQPGSDCVFTSNTFNASTGSVSCQQQWGWDITGAYKHYWLPTLASAVYGSYMEEHFPGDALAGFGGAVGVSNLKEGRVGTNLVWTPLKGFDIGAEFSYVHLNQSRPAGLASDAVLNAAGLPSFQANTNQYEGRLRVQRAF